MQNNINTNLVSKYYLVFKWISCPMPGMEDCSFLFWYVLLKCKIWLLETECGPIVVKDGNIRHYTVLVVLFTRLRYQVSTNEVTSSTCVFSFLLLFSSVVCNIISLQFKGFSSFKDQD